MVEDQVAEADRALEDLTLKEQPREEARIINHLITSHHIRQEEHRLLERQRHIERHIERLTKRLTSRTTDM